MISDKYHTWYDLMRQAVLSYHLPVSRCADPEIVRTGRHQLYCFRRSQKVHPDYCGTIRKRPADDVQYTTLLLFCAWDKAALTSPNEPSHSVLRVV